MSSLLAALLAAVSGPEWPLLQVMVCVVFANALLLPGLAAMGSWPQRPWLMARRVFGFAGLTLLFLLLSATVSSLAVVLGVPAGLSLVWGLVERRGNRRSR